MTVFTKPILGMETAGSISDTNGVSTSLCPPAPTVPNMSKKTYPAKSAGPYFPIPRPLTTTLLRIVPGDPSNASPPIHFLRNDTPPVLDSTTMTLHATVDDQSASVLLPLLATDPIPVEWFDFCLDHLSTSFLELTLTMTDHDRSQTSLIGRSVLVASDFTSHGGLIHPLLLDSTGLPVARATLDFIVITPPPAGAPLASVRNGPPRFTGHRGMGSSGPAFPWRSIENLPESFLLAALCDSKVTTVELDVQLSRDGRTIVYHDWFFRPDGSRDKDASKSSLRVPLYHLTFDEMDTLFRSMFHKSDHSVDRNKHLLREALQKRDDVSDDVLSTKIWSLTDVCEALPEEIGLLVEVKFPSSAVLEESPVPSPEKNFFVDCVLKDIFKVSRNRKREISFLTFNANLAMMLSMKQTLYPVYLSHCEILDKPCEELDPRCIDLDEGLKFAVSQKLDGMMIFNKLVETKPQVIERIKDRGLPIITYGSRNTDPEFVRHQFRMGINGVIADDVNVLTKAFHI